MLLDMTPSDTREHYWVSCSVLAYEVILCRVGEGYKAAFSLRELFVYGMCVKRSATHVFICIEETAKTKRYVAELF